MRQQVVKLSRQAHTRPGVAGSLLANPPASFAFCKVQRMCWLAGQPPHAREASSLPRTRTRCSACAPGEVYAASSVYNLPSRHDAAVQLVATYGHADS